ncbi:hypothetical protein FACS18949_10090 [Clostridia bacterium]|nr:hypothetical protein FACS18949_10090 [Clostridia bacterium]
MKTNFHTHTNFSDGENSPEEMVLSAIERGFTALGISDHAFSPYWDIELKFERLPEYLTEINRLKEKYCGKIAIFAGLEIDSLSPFRREGPDYVIGSVHDIWLDDNTRVCVDYEASFVPGMPLEKFARAYYAAMIDMVRTRDIDIVGHFDLLTGYPLFDTGEAWYRETALEAVEAVAKSGKVVEVNTGGMARGYKTIPYPEPWLLREFAKRGVSVTLSSDSHSVSTLDFGFEEADKLISGTGLTYAGISDIIRL